jgi:hypothetical protein
MSRDLQNLRLLLSGRSGRAFFSLQGNSRKVPVGHSMHLPGMPVQRRAAASTPGGRAQALLAQSGIRVITVALVEAVQRIAAAYLEGTLDVGGNVCDH